MHNFHPDFLVLSVEFVELLRSRDCTDEMIHEVDVHWTRLFAPQLLEG